MPNGRVYGKRTNRTQHVSSWIFDSDSPVKRLLDPASEQIVTHPSKSVDIITLQSSVKAVQSCSGRVESINVVAEGLHSLHLGYLDSAGAIPDERLDNETENRVLGVKDVNVVAHPRSCRDRNGKDNISKPRKIANEQCIRAEPCKEVRVREESSGLFNHEVDVTTSKINPRTETLTSKNSPAALAKTSTHQHQHKVLAPDTLVTSNLVAYTQPLLSLCTDHNDQSAPRSFQEWADSLSVHFTISKIAEASYGEVYRLSLREHSSGFTKANESVLKLITLKPPPSTTKCPVNAKKVAFMSAVEDVASEIRLLQLMSPVPGWTRFRDVSVLQGRLPRQFVNAWKYYNKNVKKSLFPDPARKASYGEDQLWAVVEMQDAGTDLETLILRDDPVMSDVATVWDIFWSVACTVAKGEEWVNFEHRDLHLGNICIRATQRDFSHTERRNSPDTEQQVSKRKLGITNLETTIIDYTLSRASPHSRSVHLKEQVVFFDLAKDTAIFQGDGADDYQYDIYRYMQSAVLYGDPAVCGQSSKRNKKRGQCREKAVGTKEVVEKLEDAIATAPHPTAETSNDGEAGSLWRQYHPLTNLVWLHFVLHTLLKHVAHASAGSLLQQVSTATPRSPHAPSLCWHLTPRQEHSLHTHLTLLDEKLSIRNLKDTGFSSAADLVAWAVSKGWLNEEDVIGRDDKDVTEVAELSRSLDIPRDVMNGAVAGEDSSATTVQPQTGTSIEVLQNGKEFVVRERTVQESNRDKSTMGVQPEVLQRRRDGKVRDQSEKGQTADMSSTWN